MIRIMAFIRSVLALDKASRVLGEVAHDAIRKYMIPQVEQKIKAARTDSELERLTELLAQYQQYSDPRTQESKLFGEIAERVIQGAVRQYNLQPSEEDELAAQVATDFYMPLVKGSKPLMHALSKHRVDEGPVGLSKYFSYIVKLRAGHLLKKLRRRYDLAQFQYRSDEPGDVDVIDRQKATGPLPSELESDEIAMREGLEEYIKRNSRDNIMRELYRMWMIAIAKRGAGTVNMDKYVYAPLLQKYDVSKSGLAERFIALKKLIDDYYNKELGVRLTDAFRKKIHISSMDAIAIDEFRHRFAAWMLCLPSV